MAEKDENTTGEGLTDEQYVRSALRVIYGTGRPVT